MALGANIDMTPITSSLNEQVMYAASAATLWKNAIDAGGPAVADNGGSTITNPTTQITAATRHILQRNCNGTNIKIRLGYDDGLTGITSPVIQVFGRTGTDPWQPLHNAAGDTEVTLTAATGDVEDGTLKYSDCLVGTHWFDCQGNNQILVGIKTALAGSGVVNNSIIQIAIL